MGRVRTFAGCWRCRERRVKCDEEVPSCGQCRRYGASCPGYNQRLAWVSRGGRQMRYEPQRRRTFDARLTWGNEHPAYTSSQLDTMLSLLDLELHANQMPEDVEVLSGPFSAMQLGPTLNSALERPLSLEPDWDGQQSGLFYHYLFSVAPLMMPFNLPQNPWNSTYPLLARSRSNSCHDCLLYAILAQAAANLAHLNCRKDEMMTRAYKYHSKALELLRANITSDFPDFVSFLAATLTLIMAEIYLGMNHTWRIHLQAAWSFLVNSRSESDKAPWLQSDSAWVVTQSLCLMKIRTECNDIVRNPEHPASSTAGLTGNEHGKESFIESIMDRQDFGFTAGLDRGIINTLLRIQAYATNPTITLNSAFVQELVMYLQARIADTRTNLSRLRNRKADQETRDGQAAAHHTMVVVNGTMIYLQRLIGNCSPSQVDVFVSQVFESVEAYRGLGGRNMTVWPVFQAAVEACGDINQHRARRWLADSIRLGIGNRRHLRQVVISTWKRREAVASVLDVEPEHTVVDWKMMIPELDVDVLLI